MSAVATGRPLPDPALSASGERPAPMVVIGIATAGRREQMPLTLAQLARQHQPPARVIVCPASPADFDEAGAPPLPCPLVVVHGARGSCAQRNAVLAACDDADVVVFIDDDYYPAPDYVEQVQRLFAVRPEVVVATHHPVRDGAVGPGIGHDTALAILAALPPQPEGAAAALRTTYGGYGCNMAVRLAPARAHGVLFDVNLPLYGWLEDIDFSRRMAAHGAIVDSPALRGVHLGSKRGRTSGLRFGYSQVANPVYLLRKGSMSASYALRHIAKNFAKNLARAAWPEPWVDRRGRLKGNLLAVGDLLRGRLDPGRIRALG